jgi:CHRD domain-containing protein
MGKLALRGLVLAVVIGLLGLGSYAIAGGGTKNFNGSPMNGYEENPDVSSVASGSFEARLSKDGTSLAYVLSYSGLEGTVTQSHIHFGKPAINGGISIWLCGTTTNPSPSVGTPTCPQSGTVTGEVDMTDVVGPAGQGIAPTEFAEILAALRAGHAYANVHSSKFPGGEIRAQINNRRGNEEDDD